VAVPIVNFAACLVAGAFAGSQWLPSLAAGPVGGVAFFAVCGLLGAALGVIGLHIYEIVEASRFFRNAVVAAQLSDMLFQAGAILGLGVAIYLLAPRATGTSQEHGD
jgi:hypothetical protein